MKKSKLSLKQYHAICDAHEEETLWYLFLNHGNPLGQSNTAYNKRFKAMTTALTEYVAFMEQQRRLLEEERPLYL